MKKYTLIFAIAVSLTMVACGSGSTTNQTTDSTAAMIDSTAVGVTDSTTAQIPADTTVKEVK